MEQEFVIIFVLAVLILAAVNLCYCVLIDAVKMALMRVEESNDRVDRQD